MRFFAVALVFFGVAASYAQAPEVPHKMRFADMTLTIRDDARREIQKDVDALTQYPRYFGIKVERAKTYFPIIEKIFKEEGLPDDFKYLVLQESALISDAVSVSNAVGFWQFKDFTALEMGLRVDKDIDERMNIYSASRGAARYLKKNNNMFNNWLIALQSYQMGAGGVRRSLGNKYDGMRHMEITSETYWYIKKFLAHKVAFENALTGEPQVKVMVYESRSKKTLKELASELSVEESVLEEYNKWARKGVIHDDRTYAVVIPTGTLDENFNNLVLASSKASKAQPIATRPVISDKKQINGIEAIRAISGESMSALAIRAGVGLSDFLKYNEVSVDHEVEAGQFYFTGKKKTKTNQPTHTAKLGDNLWAISQQYGVRVSRLKRFNRKLASGSLKRGEVVWLIKKPKARPVPTEKSVEDAPAVVEVATDEFFNWEVKSPSSKVVVPETHPAPAQPVLSSTQITITEKEESKEELEPEVKKETTQIPPLVHQVLAGETLTSISKKYMVTISELVAWNNLNMQMPLKLGQELKVVEPIAAKLEEKQIQVITHEVKASDTLYSVARQYNVTIKQLMEWNSKSDFSLVLGEKLKIVSN